jgi:SAM-dependent methyltransferase
MLDRYGESIISDLIQSERQTILNIGSSSTPYKWMPPETINADLFYKQLTYMGLPVAADCEKLPFRNEAFDIVLCIGSVINYCSALEALIEISRVTKRNGYAMIHYESSNSLENIFTKRWRGNIIKLNTLNSKIEDHIWIYSNNYIESAVREIGFNVIERRGFHILSSLALRFGVPQATASRLAVLDRIFGYDSNLSDDVIILCQKSA